MSFAFPLPTTGSVRFHAVLQDPSSSHTRDLQRATTARSRLRFALKACRKIKEDSKRDWSGVLKALLDYLPHLCAVEQAIEQDALIAHNIAFSWRPVLSSSSLRKSTRVPISSLHYERAFCLLTLGLTFINLASRSVASLGDYEHRRNTSEAERKRLDEQLNAAADSLCRAAGIFDHINHELLPKWDQSSENGQPQSRPLDVSSDVLIALSNFALADAEALALRRLMSKAAADIAISPGPPLPRSHPPPSLLSKLQLNVHNLLDTALGHISSSSSPSKFSSLRRSDESSQEIWSDWRKHLSRLALLSAARAHKWLGVEAGELTKDVGRAVAWLQLAEKEVSGLASPKAFTSFKSSSQKQIQGVVKVELAHIQAFLKVYKKMNDTVMFQAVPPASDLLSTVPGGRAALSKKSYLPPSPAFKVSTVRPVGEQTPDLTSLDLDGDGDQTSSESDDEEGDEGSSDVESQPEARAVTERYF